MLLSHRGHTPKDMQRYVHKRIDQQSFRSAGMVARPVQVYSEDTRPHRVDPSPAPAAVAYSRMCLFMRAPIHAGASSILEVYIL